MQPDSRANKSREVICFDVVSTIGLGFALEGLALNT